MRFEEADVIEIRYAQKQPICNNVELRQILLSPYLLPAHVCGYALLASQIMRPRETNFLNWYNNSFTIDIDRQQIVSMQHPSYKAELRTLDSNLKKITYLMLPKPFFSKWLSARLLQYRRDYGECREGQVFPWTTSGALTRALARLRDKHGHELPFLHDLMNGAAKGAVAKMHRVHTYTFRHFGFTFHYWVTFNQDILALRDFAGHQDVETTWQYVHTKEEIGLTQEMIDRNISWDEFVFGIDLHQAKITAYIKKLNPLPIPAKTKGQRSILHYIQPDPLTKFSNRPVRIVER